MVREVTEKDFRCPEYRDAKVEDYEFRSDGALVRKDRWETAIQSIRYLVGIDAREFEIPEVVDAVRKLVDRETEWNNIDDESEQDEFPESPDVNVEIKLTDGSILKNCCYIQRGNWFVSAFKIQVSNDRVLAWRVQESL